MNGAEGAAGAGALHTRLRALMAALAGMLGDRVLLLSLELRLAGRAFATIVALAVGAAVAVLTAWLGLWLALGAWIVDSGASHAVAALIVIVANGVIAALCLARARALARLLTLPATLRTLTGNAQAGPEPQPPFAEPQAPLS